MEGRLRSRAVFFETLTSIDLPLIAWFLLRGLRLYVFDFTCDLKRRRWIRKLLDSGRLERVYVQGNSVPDSLAIEATEWVFPRFARHGLIRSLSRIFGGSEVVPVFKKALLESVFRYVYIRWFLARCLTTHGRDLDVVLISAAYGRWERQLREWSTEHLTGTLRLRIPWYGRLWSATVQRVGTGLFGAGALLTIACHLACIWLGRRWTDRGPVAASVRHVYVLDQPFQVKFDGPRGFDFLLDHRRVTKENTLFLIGHNGEGSWLARARSAGYRILRLSKFADGRSPRRHLRNPPRHLPLRPVLHAAGRIGRCLFAPGWMAEAAVRGLITYLTASAPLERVRFANYVYMNRDDIAQQWLNLLVRRRGGQTWNFAFSIGGGYVYGEGNDFGDRHRFWAYQNADHFVASSQALIDYHRRHPQAVRHYHAVGNIWSESVRVVLDALDLDEVRAKWFGQRGRSGRVLAWFDTSFVEAENSPSTFRGAIAWYRDIQRLMADDERLLCVIKPSKDEAFFVDERSQWSHPLGKEILRVWEELKCDPRVHFAGHDGDPATIIAASDLTVTFCFSSPTAEALGAGRPAIWYEPGERWRTTLYGVDPMLTAHGYEELRTLVSKLLYDVTEEEYRDYLENKVRGLVEEFFDGKGLSRFRALLVAASNEVKRTS